MTAPLESVMFPASSPRADCAFAVLVKDPSASKNNKTGRNLSKALGI
jgi:hypothetical protein